MNRDERVGVCIGFLAGITVGGIVALLTAPRSGRETREIIKDKVATLVEQDPSEGAFLRVVRKKGYSGA